MKDQPDALPLTELEPRALPSLRDARAALSQVGALPLTRAFQQHEVTDNATRAEIYDTGDRRVPDGSIAIKAGEISMGALERVRFFVNEKTEQTQQKWNMLRGKKLGALLAGGALFVAASPIVEKLTENVPIVRELTQTPIANAAETVDYGTGGYPWPDARRGELDPYGSPKGECSSYVLWELASHGIPSIRFAHFGQNMAKYAEAQGEIVDQVPAVGAVISWFGGDNYPNGHVAYIKKVEGNKLTYADYNGTGGSRSYGEATVTLDELKESKGRVIHFEVPVTPDTRKNILKQAGRNLGNYAPEGLPMDVNGHLQSKNGNYNLIMQWDGNLVLYDKKLNVVWESDTTGTGARKYKLNKGALSIYTDSGRIVKKFQAKGSKLVIENNGTLNSLKPDGKVASVIASVSKNKVGSKKLQKLAR